MTAHAPQGLSARSRRLWRRVTEEFELPPGALLILESVLHTWDELTQLEKIADEVTAAGEMFHVNNAGALRPHPCFEEIRRHRALLEKQATALDLPHLSAELGTKPSHKPPSAASTRAQKAAQARWGTRGHTAPAPG